jgi:molybdopterin converting factor small subunit
MALRVLAFARLRELLGFGERTLDIAAFCHPEQSRGAATIEDIWTSLTASSPEAVRMRASTRFACNGVIVDGATRVSDGDEIALLPPVGGG